MVLLGTITALTTATKDNGNTAVPFVIPAGVKKLLLQSDVDSVFVGFIAATAGALATAAGLKITTAFEKLELELEPIEAVRILAINNQNGSTANVKVFRLK